MNLNAAQLEAAAHREGPAVVAAVPGSGKTALMTWRAAEMIRQRIPEASIAMVTFSRKAADEMALRLTRELGREPGIACSTFHSLCLRIIRAHRKALDRQPPAILESYQVKTMVRQAIKDTLGPKENGAVLPADVISLMGLQKAENFDPTEALVRAEAVKKLSERERWVYQSWDRYEQLRADRGDCLDFDDMLCEAVRVLRDEPGWRDRVASKWQWLSVDEYQDSNTVQEQFLELIAGEHRNIFVVGDPDQTVHAWRGARPELIVTFADRWGAKLYTMQDNYRCSRAFCGLANLLIKSNKTRLETVINAMRDEDGSVTARQFLLSDDEAGFVASEIERGIAEGREPGSYMLLYRVNSYSRACEMALGRAKIPYVVLGSLGFFGRADVKDMLAYLHVTLDLAGASLEDSYLRIVNKPSRYFGREACEQWKQSGPLSLESLVTTDFSRPYMGRAAREFSDLIRELRIAHRSGDTTANLIAMVRDLTDYDKWASGESEGQADDSIKEALDELQAVAETYSMNTGAFLGYCWDQAARAARESQKDEGRKVRLMSFYRSKGLEADTVFCVGLTDRMLPHVRSGNIEEERRLLFVGMTRARTELYLTAPSVMWGKPVNPSPFLAEARAVMEMVQETVEEEKEEADVEKET